MKKTHLLNSGGTQTLCGYRRIERMLWVEKKAWTEVPMAERCRWCQADFRFRLRHDEFVVTLTDADWDRLRNILLRASEGQLLQRLHSEVLTLEWLDRKRAEFP
jgi:hypothetical protein